MCECRYGCVWMDVKPDGGYTTVFAVPIPVFIHLHFFKAEFLSLAE